MTYSLQLMRLGRMWYIEVPHETDYLPNLGKKISRILNMLYQESKITIVLSEVTYNVSDTTIVFEDSSITRYFTTNDDFKLKFQFNNREFELDSELFGLLEELYDLQFHSTNYELELWK